MNSPLVFENTSKYFNRTAALRSLSLEVKAGEIFGFLGPNGAGKTTALHVAMGFLHPSSGGGTLLGEPFAQARPARGRVGYVPDAPVFFAGTALENVLFVSRVNRPEQAESRTHARRLLRSLDLPEKEVDARRFSRGMQQRLALAQALVTRPQLLILDEPTSALDPPGVLLVRDVLERVRDEGTAIFFSSHQLEQVELLCDRAAFLTHGRLRQIGHMQDLLHERDFASITLRGVREEMLSSEPFCGTARPRQERASGDLMFRVPVRQQQAFLEGAWMAGAELVAVARERRTLEELFASPEDGTL